MHRIGFWLCALFAMAAAIGSAPAAEVVDLDQTDVIRGKIWPWSGGRFFLGEPVVLELRLSNHARKTLSIETNFVPQSNMEIEIVPPDSPQRSYGGPFEIGQYPMLVYELKPLEEISEYILIWADPTQEGGLAFDKPGVYQIRTSLVLRVIETDLINRVPLETVTIMVEPTPPQLEPMVKQLAQLEAFAPLHLRRLTAELVDEMEAMLTLYPANAIFPYIVHGLANYYTFQLNKGDEAARKEALEKSLYYYQVAAQSTTAFKMAAYLDLLRLLDNQGMARIASQIAAQMLTQMPQQLRGAIGGFKDARKITGRALILPELLNKYLINTRELDRERHWLLLP